MNKTIEVGVKVRLFRSKRSGVRCGHCGRRMPKGSVTAAPERLWIGPHPICNGHKRCVVDAIRCAILNDSTNANKAEVRQDLRMEARRCLRLIRDMITTGLAAHGRADDGRDDD